MTEYSFSMLEPPSGPGLGLHGGGCPHDGLDDLNVTGAAAQVSRDGLPHLGRGRIRVPLQEGLGGEDHPRRAEATLGGAVVNEGLLDGVELPVLGETLDGE